jgi:hypothetical protein
MIEACEYYLHRWAYRDGEIRTPHPQPTNSLSFEECQPTHRCKTPPDIANKFSQTARSLESGRQCTAEWPNTKWLSPMNTTSASGSPRVHHSSLLHPFQWNRPSLLPRTCPPFERISCSVNRAFKTQDEWVNDCQGRVPLAEKIVACPMNVVNPCWHQVLFLIIIITIRQQLRNGLKIRCVAWRAVVVFGRVLVWTFPPYMYFVCYDSWYPPERRSKLCSGKTRKCVDSDQVSLSN